MPYQPFQPQEPNKWEDYCELELEYADAPPRTLVIGDNRAAWPADQAESIGPAAAIMSLANERVEQVLWRAMHSDVDYSALERVVVVAGMVNLLQTWQPPRDIAYGVQQVVQAVRDRAPAAEIRTVACYEAQLPFRSPFTEDRRTEFNRRLAKRAASSGLFQHVALQPMNVDDSALYRTAPGGERLCLTPAGFLPVTSAVAASFRA